GDNKPIICRPQVHHTRRPPREQVVTEEKRSDHAQRTKKNRYLKSDRYKRGQRDRKSTRLNSSHVKISYAVFCLKKKKTRHSIHELMKKILNHNRSINSRILHNFGKVSIINALLKYHFYYRK